MRIFTFEVTYRDAAGERVVILSQSRGKNSTDALCLLKQSIKRVLDGATRVQKFKLIDEGEVHDGDD